MDRNEKRRKRRERAEGKNRQRGEGAFMGFMFMERSKGQDVSPSTFPPRTEEKAHL